MRHAGCNAGANIEAIGLERLGSKAGRVMLTLRRERKAPSILPAMPAGSTRVKGRPDAEGSYGGTPVKRQAPIEGGVVWPDSTPSYFGMACKILVGKASVFVAEPEILLHHAAHVWHATHTTHAAGHSSRHAALGSRWRSGRLCGRDYIIYPEQHARGLGRGHDHLYLDR